MPFSGKPGSKPDCLLWFPGGVLQQSLQITGKLAGPIVAFYLVELSRAGYFFFPLLNSVSTKFQANTVALI